MQIFGRGHAFGVIYNQIFFLNHEDGKNCKNILY